MATTDDIEVQRLEQIIGHTFLQKHLIYQARTSAGANPDNYDGNRKLSQLGASLVDSVLALIVFFIGGSRECTANLRKAFLNKNRYSIAAKRTGIDGCIRYNERTGPNSPGVHRKAINAIIAAVLLDTSSIRTTLVVISRIFFQASDNKIFCQLPSVSPATVEDLSSIPKFILILDSGVINPSMLSVERSVTPVEISPLVHRFLEQGCKEPHPILLVLEKNTTENALDLESTPSFIRDDIWSSSEDLSPNGAENEADNDLMATLSDELAAPSPPGGGQVSRRQRDPLNDSEAAVVTHVSKRRCKTASTSVSVLCGQAAVQILSQERERCATQNMPPPEESYFSPAIVTRALKLERDSLGSLAILLITIASPQSIVALRDMMCCERAQKTIDSHRLGLNITNRRRYEIIKELDKKTTLLRLLRWHHVLDLFEQCGGSRTRSSTGYVNTSSVDFAHSKRRPGNPSKRDDSKVAQAMMDELYPDIVPTSPVYTQELATIKHYRKLGQRLFLLTDRFGRGILGLILASTLESEISDQLLLSPRNETFRDFVNLLQESHGQWLTRFSDAVLSLLTPLLQFSLDNTWPSQLECMDPGHIMGQPKCSESLLRLIA